MNYSNMSDEELLNIANNSSNQNTSNDYSKMSDEELLSIANGNNHPSNSSNITYNPNKQQYNVQITQDTYKPKHPFLAKVQRPFLRQETKERKDFLTKYNDTNVPSYQEISDAYKSGQIDKNRMLELSERRKTLDHYSADEDYQKVRNQNIGKGALDLGLAAIPLGVGGQVTKGIGALVKQLVTRQGIKRFGTTGTRMLANGLNVAGHTGAGAAEGAGFGAIDYGFDKLADIEHDDNLRERMTDYAKFGAMLGSGIGAFGAVGSNIARTKPIKNFNNWVSNSEGWFPHFLANAKNALGMKIGGNNNVSKYQKFEKVLQDIGLPQEEINANILEYSKLTKYEQRKVDKALRKQLMEAKDRPLTEKPTLFGEEPVIPTKQNIQEGLVHVNDNSLAQHALTPEEKLEEIKSIAREKKLVNEQVIELHPEDYNMVAQRLRELNGWDDAQIAEYLNSKNIRLKEQPVAEQNFEFVDEQPAKENVVIDSDTPEVLKGHVENPNIEITSDTSESLKGRVTNYKQPEFDAADDVTLFEKAREYKFDEQPNELANEPKQLKVSVPKIKPDTKKTIAEWRNKYRKSSDAGSPVKSEEGVNTPKDIETLENEQSIASKNEYSVPEEYELEKEGIFEEESYSRKFQSDDVDFNKWYSEFENAEPNIRESMAAEKLHSFETKESAMDFFNKLEEQVERDARAAERTGESAKVTEDDLLNFASKFKVADVLPKTNANALNAADEIARREISGKTALEILGYGKNKDINLRIARDISRLGKKGKQAKSADKSLEFAAFGKLNKQKSKLAVDKMYEKMKERINKYKHGGYDTSRIENALDKAYARKLEQFGIKLENKTNAKPVNPQDYIEYKRQQAQKSTNKPYPYQDKTVMGIESENKINSRMIDGEIITANPSEKYSKINYDKVHYAKDYAEDLSAGNELVKNIIENSKVTFKFDNIGGHGYTDARNYNNITLNKNESLEDTIIAGRHEVGHILQKYIAEFDEDMAKIVRETEYANKCFNNACKGVSNKTISEYIKWDSLPEEELTKRLDKLSDVEKDKYWEITDSYNDYKYSEGEQLSVQASKGDYSGYGEENLQRVYNRRIGQDKQTNNGNKGQRPENGKEERNSGDEPRIRDSIGELFSKHDGGRRSIGKTNEQPIGLKDIKKTDFKASKYRKYNKASGLSPKEWLDNIKKIKSNYGLTDAKTISLVNRATAQIKTMSDETEKLLIKRGIITKEQAANRKKMVGSNNYIADAPEYLSDGSINLSKDYSDTKVGATGQRAFRNVKNTSLEKYYKNAQAYNAQAKYVDSVMDYIHKNFAKPIENGKTLSGYKAVNSDILSTAIFRRLSKQWYNTISDGAEAINKAFKNEKVAQGWIDLSNRANTPDIQIPEEVFNSLLTGKGETAAEFIERYGAKYPLRATTKLIGAVHDAMVERFKQRVLTSASFFTNNRLGNQTLILAKSDNPVQYIKSLYDAWKVKDSDVPIGILESNITDEIKSFNIRKKYTGYAPLDNAFNLFGGQLLDTKTLKGMKKLNATALNWFVGKPARGFALLSDKVMNFNQKFENLERKQVFAQHIDKTKRDLIKRTGQKMITQQEVIDQIHKDSPLRQAIIDDIQNTIGDYSNFSKQEQQLCKRILPFYSWYRTITRHTYQLAKKYPERASLIMYELDNIKNNKQEDLKEYQRGSFKVGKNKLTGDNLVLNKTHAFPYMTFREDLGVNPYLQVPVEAIRGKKFFQNQELTNNRYVRYNQNGDTKYLDIKTGETLDKLPTSTRLGYVAKQLVWNNTLPYLENPMLDINKTSGAIANKITKDESKIDKGKWQMYDKTYDATILGGYNIGDIEGATQYKNKYGKDKLKVIERSGKSRYPWYISAINRGLGLSIQNENPKTKFDKENSFSIAKKINKWRKKHKKK